MYVNCQGKRRVVNERPLRTVRHRHSKRQHQTLFHHSIGRGHTSQSVAQFGKYENI